MAGILWLSSYPKSGNTWLRAYLDNLFRNPARPIPIDDLPNHVLGDNFLIHYEQFTGKTAADLGPEEIAALRPRVHQWFAHSGADTVLVKTHQACVLADGRPLITPAATAGAVYVIRNPFDIAPSFADHYQVPIQRAVDLLCDDGYFLPAIPGQLEQVLMSWSSHVKSWTRAPDMRLCVMRYEDMLANPREAYRALFGFLRLPVDKAKLRRTLKATSFRALQKQERESGFHERPPEMEQFFATGRAGGWREALTPGQAARIRAEFLPVLERWYPEMLDQTRDFAGDA